MIYLFLADGFEEVEAITPIDFLRRADINIVTVGVGKTAVKGAHGVTVNSDISDDQVILNDELEGIVLPGGMPGTKNLEKSEVVQSALDFCINNKRLIAAICAAPSILGHRGILDGIEATCYPGFESECVGAKMRDEPVCCDKNIITGMGAGTAVQFAEKIIAYFKGEAASCRVLKGVRWNI